MVGVRETKDKAHANVVGLSRDAAEDIDNVKDSAMFISPLIKRDTPTVT